MDDIKKENREEYLKAREELISELEDPLSETTRKSRRNLMVSSSIGFFVKVFDLNIVGIEFQGMSLKISQDTFFAFLGVLVTYFLIAFYINLRTDNKINILKTALRNPLYTSNLFLQNEDIEYLFFRVKKDLRLKSWTLDRLFPFFFGVFVAASFSLDVVQVVLFLIANLWSSLTGGPTINF